jgi:hypothetical protein
MTRECFSTVRELSEVPEGLRIHHHDGQTSLLRRDNEHYARIEELLRRAQRRSVPWPVRIARSPDGVLVNAWQAWGGQPLLVEDVVSADECVVYFMLQNTPKMVKHSHPNYQHMLETLMEAAASGRKVFYVEQPGEADFLADVCLAP